MTDPTTATLEELLAMDDEVGVITVSVGFAPSDFADGLTGPDTVRAQLRKLGAGTEHEEAVQARVSELSDRIEALLDPRGEGRGRYLAATVSGDAVVEHRFQVPLPPMADLDDGPTVRHLLEVFDEHQPAAALLLHANEATLLQVGFSGHEELDDWAFRVGEIVLGDDKGGPGPAGQAGAGHPVNPGGVSHKEAQEDRVQENRDRFLRDVADDVRSIVEQRGLDRVVLVGQAHERSVVRDAFGSGNGIRLLDVDRIASGDVRDTIDEVSAALSDQHAAREVELVDLAADRTRAEGRGAYGPRDVTRALVEGRVEHLLLAPDLDLQGWMSEDGHLVIDEEDPRVADATEEPRFVHRMIERALGTDADVTPVDGAAAEKIGELGGVAALLRW